MAPPKVDVELRFLQGFSMDQETGCWIWNKGRTGKGYGTIFMGGSMHDAHRIGYRLFVGIPNPNLVLHHTCFNGPGGCVNPAHLQEVTRSENVRLEWHDKCARGHDISDPSTYYSSNGRRNCKQCVKLRQQKKRE